MMTSDRASADSVGTSIEAGGQSDAGRVRTVNQDSWFAGRVGHQGFLAVVADGMGGHQTGEVASQKAVRVLRDQIESSRKHPPHAIAHAAQAANQAIYSYAQTNPEHDGMGTTLTTVFIDDRASGSDSATSGARYLMSPPVSARKKT
jgi:serine/threonine protein phosphatase PrpC